MKLEIEIDLIHLELLRALKRKDKSSECIGDVIRRLILEEADRKNVKNVSPSNPYSAEINSVMEDLLNTMFKGAR